MLKKKQKKNVFKTSSLFHFNSVTKAFHKARIENVTPMYVKTKQRVAFQTKGSTFFTVLE